MQRTLEKFVVLRSALHTGAPAQEPSPFTRTHRAQAHHGMQRQIESYLQAAAGKPAVAAAPLPRLTQAPVAGAGDEVGD